MRQTRSAFRDAIRLALLTLVLPVIGAGESSAQVGPAPAKKAFVGVSVGAQPRRQSLTMRSTAEGLYGEGATFDGTQSIGNGPIFDVAGGYRVWENFFVGVGYSSFSKKGDSSVTARIPNPLFFDQFKTVTQAVSDLEHKEQNVYLQGMWFFDVSEKIDVAVQGGVAFVSVTQARFTAFGVPSGTQDLSFKVGSESQRTTGGTVGFDGTYLVRRNIGVGLFMRYVAASVAFPAVGDEKAGFVALNDVKAGGFHVGVGIRYRF